MSNPSARAPDLLDEALNLQASIGRLRRALKVQQRQFEAWDRLLNPRNERQIASDRLVYLQQSGAL